MVKKVKQKTKNLTVPLNAATTASLAWVMKYRDFKVATKAIIDLINREEEKEEYIMKLESERNQYQGHYHEMLAQTEALRVDMTRLLESLNQERLQFD